MKQTMRAGKNKLVLIMCIAMMMVATFFTGCSNKEETKEPTASPEVTVAPTEEAKNPATEIKKDLAGYDVEIPEEINKIIVLAPSDAEILVALGVADKIIGIDKYGADVEGIKEGLPQFNMMEPDAEKLVSMGADVIFTTGMASTGSEDTYKPVKDAGVCVVTTPSASSIDGIKESILFLGKVVNKEDKANEIIANMEKEIAEIKAIGDTITDKKSVYFEISAAPYCYTFGQGTFLNEMVEVIGATNVFADQKDWISVSEEDVIAKNPDVILTSVNYIEDPVKEILDRKGWNNVTAVKDKQVYVIDANSSARPSQNIIKALKEMAKAVYPEQYKDEN